MNKLYRINIFLQHHLTLKMKKTEEGVKTCSEWLEIAKAEYVAKKEFSWER